MQEIELVVVIPVYNEEGAITGVVRKWVQELLRLQIDYQMHIYNDGSRDRTQEILRELSSKNPGVVVHSKANSGHGPTILQGYRENSDATWILQIDSDDEIGTESFETLWSKREGYDFLLGCRNGKKRPWSRKIVSGLSRLTVKALYGKGVYDVNSPFRIMRGEVFRDLFFLIPETVFAPNVLVAGYAAYKNLSILEVPVTQTDRRTGEVSIKKFKLLKAALKSLLQTVRFRLFLAKAGH
jgi:dolichol-phosphate mannosyltransferase